AAGGPGGVVLVAVAFAAESVHAGMAGIVDADVDAVPGGADPWGEAVSPGADDLDDGVFERGFGVTTGAADAREGGRAAGGVVEITAQVPQPFAGGRCRDVGGPDAADDLVAVPG